MAIQVGNLELYPAVETIGIHSKYSGADPHIAVMQYRPSGDSWRGGMTLTLDDRPMVKPGPGQADVVNTWAYEWRGVIFGAQPNSLYDVRVTYFTREDFLNIYSAALAELLDPGLAYIATRAALLANGSPLGYHEGSVRTRNNNPPIGTNYLVVSLSGNDAGSGSEADPLRTRQRAMELSGPGTTILLRGGTYLSPSAGNEPGMNVNKSGTPESYITIMPFNSEPVIFDDTPRTSGDAYRSVISLGNYSYIRLRGITIQNAYRSSILLNGNSETVPSAPGVGRGCIIEDMVFIDCRRAGGNDGDHVWLRNGGGTDVIIQRNRFYQDNYAQVYPIRLWRPGWGVVACDNIFRSLNGLIRDAIGGGPENDIKWTHEFDIYRNDTSGHSDDGYQVEGACRNLREWQNTISGGFVGIALAPCLIGPAFPYRNIIFNYTNGMFKLGDVGYGDIYAYHNTGVGAEGFKQTNDGLRNFHSRNNIIDVRRYVVEFYKPPVEDCDLDRDLVFSDRPEPRFKWTNGSWMTLAEFINATGQESRGIWGQGSFFNKASGDLRLLPGSLGIDQGEILPGFNDADSPCPYAGDAPDLGAIEADGSAPPPTADFTASPIEGPAPLTVSFTNKSTGAIDSRLWEFGDGQTSDDVNPTHVFANPQETPYIVRLTVTGPGGSNSAAINIMVAGTVVNYTLTINPGVGGSTEPGAGQYPYPAGTSRTINATALPGYVFSHWEVNGEIDGADTTLELIVDTDMVITPVFDEVVIPPNEFSVTISTRGTGSTDPGVGAHTVPENEEFEVEAIPGSGWKFDHWEGDVSGTDRIISFTVTRNVSIVAVFKKEPLGFIELLWGIAPFFPWEGPPLPRFSGLDWEELRT